MYSHIKAIEALKTTTGTLPVNIRFIVEGEEVIGGAYIAKYVAENPDKLSADVALVSDTAMYAEGMPTLCIGLRGLVYLEVEAAGPKRDLHSGLYGGAAPNAVFGLPDDGLHSPNEKYKIENYYMGIMTVAHFLEQYAGD